MKKEKTGSDKEHRVLARLALYIIVLGWLFAGFYVVIIYSYSRSTEILYELAQYFLSTEQAGIRFRALIFFAPFLATVIGFLVYEKAKLFRETNRLLEKYEHLSKTDMLTGLLNRGALIDALEYEIERVKRYGSGLSLILCDIDNFKNINDTFGHSEGDRALKDASKFLKKSTRRIDIVGRYGGDEFMLILPETPMPGAIKVAERISLISTAELHLSGLSMSIGVTDFFETSDTVDALIKRADDALYASKRAGKNKVTYIRHDSGPGAIKS